MSPAVVVEKEPAAEKSKAVAAAKAEKRKVPPTEATPPAAAKKAAAAPSAPPAATEVAKQVDKFFLPCFPLKNFSQDYYQDVSYSRRSIRGGLVSKFNKKS